MEAPERPSESDCCGSGCSPCIMDVYEAKLRRWREGQGGGEGGPAYLSQTRLKPFTVARVADLPGDLRALTFRAPAGDEPLGLAPGQHVFLRARAGLSRAYTPVRDGPGEFDVVARIYPEGRMSGYLARLGEGDTVRVRGPYGGFAYRPNAFRRVLMLCAGTGVAPAYSVARAIVADESDETRVRLAVAAREADAIPLRGELRELARNWNFTYRAYVGRGAALYGEDVRPGRLDAASVAAELPHADGVLVLVCGTDAFNRDMAEHVRNVGVPGSNVHIF